MITVVQDPVDKQIRVLVAGLSSDLIPRFTAMIRDATHLLSNPLFLPVLSKKNSLGKQNVKLQKKDKKTIPKRIKVETKNKAQVLYQKKKKTPIVQPASFSSVNRGRRIWQWWAYKQRCVENIKRYP